MPQEELDRFPQCRLAQPPHGLRVFFDSDVQSVARSENLPRRHEAFQFRCPERPRRFGAVCQLTQNLPSNVFSLRLDAKVSQLALACLIVSELVHLPASIHVMIKFDGVGSI